MLMKSRHRVKLHWTTGPLDQWTLGLLNYFLGHFFITFWDHILDIIWTLFFFRTILTGKGRPLVLREGRKANCCYWGRAGIQPISTLGGVEGKLLLLA